MNALLVICGLGFISLIAEIANIKKLLAVTIILGLAAAAMLIVLDWNTDIHYYNDMVVFDNFSIAFTTLIIAITVFWFWMASDYFRGQSHQTDRSTLVLFAVAGAIIMVSFNNMAMLFLGIEILSICLYILAGSNKDSLLSNEAAFKYFLMGSFSTGFLLMGIALIYGATGFFHLDKIAGYIQAHPTGLPGFFYSGVLLIVVGMAFKVSAVPFHFWAPVVDEGSPTLITALMSTVVKVAAFAAFFRLLAYCFPQFHSSVHLALLVISLLTLVGANVTAVYQINVKRMLAYSSVGHAGYILLALVAGGRGLGNAIFYYLAAYSAATLTAFCVLDLIEQQYASASVDSFNGLFKKSPFFALAMSVALLSLAGIPPLAGFLGKYMVFAIAINQGYLNLVILGVVTSLIGVFYYFRVIVAIYFKEPSPGTLTLSLSTQVLL